MWTKLDKPKTVLATKSLVNEFVNMDVLPRDRPLSERRLLVYRRLLADGEFRPVTWASAFCEETGSTYRINGKYTSIVLSEQDPIPEFYVTIERYSCPTMEDVATLYSTFALATRTSTDVILSFASPAERAELLLDSVEFTV